MRISLSTAAGRIDLVWASRDVLLSLPGFNEQIVDRFLELRRGPDESMARKMIRSSNRSMR